LGAGFPGAGGHLRSVMPAAYGITTKVSRPLNCADRAINSGTFQR